jgi:hypothetical protein
VDKISETVHHKNEAMCFLVRDHLTMLLSFSRPLAAVAFSAWATLAFAAQNQTSPSTNWPTTVEGTVEDILSNMSDDVKMQIRISRKDHLIELHFGLMAGIRNRYGIGNGNDKLMLSACGHPCRPEDASIKIIEAVWDALQK